MSTGPVSDWRPATDALTDRGYAVLPGAMPEAGWRRLRVEAEGLRDDDAFSPAGVGRGAERHEDGAIRGGSICWLDASMPAANDFLGWMDGLRTSLNRD